MLRQGVAFGWISKIYVAIGMCFKVGQIFGVIFLPVYTDAAQIFALHQFFPAMSYSVFSMFYVVQVFYHTGTTVSIGSHIKFAKNWDEPLFCNWYTTFGNLP
jgi:hypothetical protein